MSPSPATRAPSRTSIAWTIALASRMFTIIHFRSLSLLLRQPRRWWVVTCPSSPRIGGGAIQKFHRLRQVSQFLMYICGGSAMALERPECLSLLRDTGSALHHPSRCRRRSKSRLSGPRGGLDEAGQEGAPAPGTAPPRPWHKVFLQPPTWGTISWMQSYPMRHLVPKMSCPFWLVPRKSHEAPFLHRPPLWSKGDPGSRLLPPQGPLRGRPHRVGAGATMPPSRTSTLPPPQGVQTAFPTPT